jgi:hypothetical protein
LSKITIIGRIFWTLFRFTERKILYTPPHTVLFLGRQRVVFSKVVLKFQNFAYIFGGVGGNFEGEYADM